MFDKLFEKIKNINEEDSGYAELFKYLYKGSKKVVCSECGKIISVSRIELPKIVRCPECGWKKKVG